MYTASSTVRARFHLEAPDVTVTQNVGKIKASPFWLLCFFLLGCLWLMIFWCKKKETFKYCKLDVFLWKNVLLHIVSETMDVLCGHYMGRHRFFSVMSYLLLKLWCWSTRSTCLTSGIARGYFEVKGTNCVYDIKHIHKLLEDLGLDGCTYVVPYLKRVLCILLLAVNATLPTLHFQVPSM